VFLACTNLPTYDLIAPLERMLGKPVLTANQVTMWAVLRALHSEAQVAEQGDQRLVQVSRPSAA
jgi:maleate isomerase